MYIKHNPRVTTIKTVHETQNGEHRDKYLFKYIKKKQQNLWIETLIC